MSRLRAMSRKTQTIATAGNEKRLVSEEDEALRRSVEEFIAYWRDRLSPLTPQERSEIETLLAQPVRRGVNAASRSANRSDRQAAPPGPSCAA